MCPDLLLANCPQLPPMCDKLAGAQLSTVPAVWIAEVTTVTSVHSSAADVQSHWLLMSAVSYPTIADVCCQLSHNC